ncbi:hypothetical protein EV175_001108 [Coemansia sp. RSA 1933]|nr:hypothetical protein EV175_001108 [Coemansia sp. RSA 1933]
MPQKRRRPTNGLAYLDDDAEQVLTLEDHTIEELEAKGDTDNILQSIKGNENEDEENENENENEMEEHVGGESLDSGPARQISDFYTQEEAASLFRKPKKSKKSGSADRKRNTKRHEKQTIVNDLIDSERANLLMTRQTQIDDSSFVDDDDDLQRAIARVRKASARKNQSISDDILSQATTRPDIIKDSAAMELDDEEGSSVSGLVLSSTIEFVQNVRASANNMRQSLMADSRKNRQPVEEKTMMTAYLSSGVELPEADIDKESPVQSEKPNESNQTLRGIAEDAEFEAEPSVGSGLAATLNLLRQRNMLDTISKDQKDRERLQRNRTVWIAEQRRKEKQLQQERQRIKQLGRDLTNASENAASSPAGSRDNGGGSKRRGKADPMTQQEIEELKAREQEILDRRWAREYEEKMKDYKPDVKLEYHDDTGRQLTTKEAYKQLSHAFHGHYSGKNKIDKLMLKRERERKRMELATSSTVHDQGAALENIHRKHGTAGIVMSEQNSGDSNHKGGGYQ